MVREYISQVSEEIEGRVTEKLSKEFTRTESRILGALSKLDEFLLNPQVRTCSVAVPGTSRKNDSENREPTGDRSLGDPCPEALFSACHPSNLNDSEQDETHHTYFIQNLSGEYVQKKGWTGARKAEQIIFCTFSAEYNMLFIVHYLLFSWSPCSNEYFFPFHINIYYFCKMKDGRTRYPKSQNTQD